MFRRFRSSPAFSFGSRTATVTTSNRRERFPAPNQYSPNKQPLMEKIARQTFFAAQKRGPLFSAVGDGPGPGAYYNKELDSSFRSTSRMSLRSRHEQKVIVTPGPAHYKPRVPLKPTEYSFTKDKKDDPFRSNSKTPPPGHYDLHSSLSERSVIIGSSSRRRLLETEEEVPGPGTYKPVLRPFKSTQILIRFPKAPRQAKRTQQLQLQPGRNSIIKAAGAYEAGMSFLGKSPKGPTISHRFEDVLLQKRATLPAPNAYVSKQVLGFPASQKISFPRSSRSLSDFFEARTTVHSNSDFYDYNKHPDKRIMMKFPKDERLKIESQPTRKLGPGEYENAVKQILKLKQASPSYSLPRDKRSILMLPKDVVNSPGPAVHNIKQPNEQSVSMARAIRPNYSKRVGPGPAVYTPVPELKKSLDIRFARSRRTPDKPNKVPGPGSYELPADFGTLPSYV